MADKDLYKILGVNKNATQEELKRAYRKLTMELHPDRNPDNREEAERKFKEMKAAYDILSDEQKRATYDRYGFEAASGNGAGGGFGGGGFGGFNADVFGDIFGDIFGGGRQRQARPETRGHDLAYELDLSLEEAVNGIEKRIRIPTYIRCKSCDGSGATAKSVKRACPSCNGSGQIRIQQGFFSIAQPCPQCGGKGQIIENPCTDCHGDGRVKQQKTLNAPAKAKRANAARRRVTSTLTSVCANTPSSPAPATICTAKCRSASSPPRLVATSKYRPSAAGSSSTCRPKPRPANASA